MINRIIISFLCCFLWTVESRAQVSQLWSVSYQKFPAGLVEPVDMITDDGGNIYIACKSPTSLTAFYADYCIIKYSPTGEQLWLKTYNGPNQTTDEPTHLALGPNGNIYVTGHSTGLNTAASDFCTIKYSSQGEQLWVVRHDGPQGNTNEVRGLQVDKEANVFITGNSTHEAKGNSGSDYYTIKYDQDGNKLWELSYDRNISDDEPKAIFVDNLEDVIVAGKTNGPAFDLTTVKYRGNELLWASHYQGPSKTNGMTAANRGVAVASTSGLPQGPGQDVPNVVKADADGNIYVAGYSHGKSGGQDFVLLKYDAKGNEQWVKRYNGPGNNWDEVEDLVIDSQGNVIVTGFSENDDRTHSYSYCTIKYNTQGERLWLQRTVPTIQQRQAPNHRPDMALDSQDNVYVTGSDYLGKLYTVKYDPQGNQVWEVTSGQLGGGSSTIALDPDNHVVVSGFSFNGKDMSMLTVKYAQE